LLGWFLVWAASGLVAAAFDPSPKYVVRGVVGLVFAGVFALLALGMISAPAWLAFNGSPSPGLANLAAFVAVISAWFLVLALLFPDRGDRTFVERWRSPPARTAFDVLAVLGGAAIIVYLAHLMA
jgi:hypothetical protein